METTRDDGKNPLREIVQPFVDLFHVSRAQMAVNVSYLLEGFVYFGILNYLAMYFNDYVGLGDVKAGWMVGFLTYGITLAMFFLGGMADRWGFRRAILFALLIMFGGRAMLGLAPDLTLQPGFLKSMHLVASLGLFLVIVGYGMYQPAAYASIRQITTRKTAAMGYAMLYALMNLGGWLPTFFAPVRRAIGISGAMQVYALITGMGLLVVFFLLTRRAEREAIEKAARSRALEAESEKHEEAKTEEEVEGSSGEKVPAELWPKIKYWLKNHPLADAKFAFFIFALIPVQTLFAHNWLTLPMYVHRAYKGTWIGENFEVAVNLNPILIFILVPVVTALTQKKNVYKMVVAGTFVMAAPTFLLALGAHWWTLLGYILVMTVGEAMWQPRFLQFAAEIAPPGRTGAYMGVAQFPWFLTKLVTSLYSGWFLSRYCPKTGPMNTETMWFIYGIIAISSPVLLLFARNWLAKDMAARVRREV